MKKYSKVVSFEYFYALILSFFYLGLNTMKQKHFVQDLNGLSITDFTVHSK